MADRRPKFDLKRLHAAAARPAAYEKSGPSAAPAKAVADHDWTVLVGAVADGNLAKSYRFTTNTPASNWPAETTDDSS